MHQHTDWILEATLRIVFLFSDFHNPSMSLPPALTHLALQNKLLTQSLFIFLLTSSYGRHCIRPLSGGFSASWTKVKFSFGPTSTRATPRWPGWANTCAPRLGSAAWRWWQSSWWSWSWICWLWNETCLWSSGGRWRQQRETSCQTQPVCNKGTGCCVLTVTRVTAIFGTV